jgi:hypothetical protein
MDLETTRVIPLTMFGRVNKWRTSIESERIIHEA